MNTHNPPTFSELLAKATPGPFLRHGNAIDVNPHDQLKRVALSLRHSQSTNTDTDAELITRLLNFAHSPAFAQMQFPTRGLRDQAESILNGQTT